MYSLSWASRSSFNMPSLFISLPVDMSKGQNESIRKLPPIKRSVLEGAFAQSKRQNVSTRKLPPIKCSVLEGAFAQTPRRGLAPAAFLASHVSQD
eukprot:6211378-Pleurochrysis_carterae.AAC.4